LSDSDFLEELSLNTAEVSQAVGNRALSEVVPCPRGELQVLHDVPLAAATPEEGVIFGADLERDSPNAIFLGKHR
jgi:hypothetical protein